MLTSATINTKVLFSLVDTSVPLLSQGEIGDSGLAGESGPEGNPGDAGAPGNKGKVGPRGAPVS